MSSVKFVPPQRSYLNTKVNLKYHVTLAGKVEVKVTSEGHDSVEVIKVYKPIKYQVWTGYQQH